MISGYPLHGIVLGREADGPSADLLAGVGQRLKCVCGINRLHGKALEDHLSCGCSSSLSCVVSVWIQTWPYIESYCGVFFLTYCMLTDVWVGRMNITVSFTHIEV